MTITRRDNHWYGTEQADIRQELSRYSIANAFPVQHFADAKCACGGTIFRLALDDNEGAAVRTCTGCKTEHPIGDSAEYLDEAELEKCACPCDTETFEITVGLSLYADSDDVRWLYLGCRCSACGLVAVYGDWKNEFNGYQALLDRV